MRSDLPSEVAVGRGAFVSRAIAGGAAAVLATTAATPKEIQAIDFGGEGWMMWLHVCVLSFLASCRVGQTRHRAGCLLSVERYYCCWVLYCRALELH